MDKNLIRKMALIIYPHLKELGILKNFLNFCTSHGWFENFLKRFSSHNIKPQCESASANEELSHTFSGQILELVDEDGYTADRAFNRDEFGLN